MAEETAPNGAGEAPGVQETESQEIDWKAMSRQWERRAKENLARAAANEDAAKQLYEIQESQKTEVQKAIERAEAAEKQAAELAAQVTRAEVAAAKGIPVELLHGGTREELEAAADALIAFRGEQSAPRLEIPNPGKTPNTSAGTAADRFAAQLEESGF